MINKNTFIFLFLFIVVLAVSCGKKTHCYTCVNHKDSYSYHYDTLLISRPFDTTYQLCDKTEQSIIDYEANGTYIDSTGPPYIYKVVNKRTVKCTKE